MTPNQRNRVMPKFILKTLFLIPNSQSPVIRLLKLLLRLNNLYIFSQIAQIFADQLRTISMFN